jgi:hypothetical protein
MWWVNNIDSAFKPILQSTPAVILTTNASTLGWGAVLCDTRTGGPWEQTEQQYHINCLEMRAVLLGLRSLCKPTSFPGLQCEDEARNEEALVWAGHVSTQKMVVFDSYSSRSGEIFFNEIYKSSKQINSQKTSQSISIYV